MQVLLCRQGRLRRLVFGASVGIVALSGVGVPAHAAGASVAAYATITDEAALAGVHAIPSSRVFSTSNGGASVNRIAVGRYQVRFPKLAVGKQNYTDAGGIVHARGLGYFPPTCNTGVPFAENGDLRVNVDCRSNVGPNQYSDSKFMVSYTNGVAETGGLAFARVNGFSTLGATVTPLVRGSSVAGAITSVHTGTGRYKVDLPRLGDKRTVAVTATTAAPVRCSLSDQGTPLSTGVVRFSVSCVDWYDVNTNASFNITYADGVNLLGKLNSVSEAYGYLPVQSPNWSGQAAALQFNRIYGDNGGSVVVDKNWQSHTVRLGRQGEGLGNPVVVVTPVDDNAQCSVLGTTVAQNGAHWDLIAWVNCTEGTAGFFVHAWVRE